MPKEYRLTRTLTLLTLFVAFALPLAGQTQITITAEYQGAIREEKPKDLYHPAFGVETDTTGFSPQQIAELEEIIKTTNMVVLRDAIENAIILDLYKKGSYAALLSEAQDYVNSYPEGDPTLRAQILFYMAEAYYYQGRHQDAMLRYRELMNEYDASEVYEFARHGLCWCLIHLERYDEARAELSDTFRPISAELVISIFFAQAINGFNSGDYQYAASRFFDDREYQSIALEGIWNPLSRFLVPKNLYYRGLAHYRLSDQRTAITFFRRVAQDYPDHPKAPYATYLVGRLSFNLEDYDQAITYFNKSLNLVDDSSSIFEIRTNLAQAYYNSGRLVESISLWKEIREGWGPAVANVGLEQSYNLYTSDAFADGTNTTDSLETLLKNFAADVSDSRDLPNYQLELAKKYFDARNYEKVLEWTAEATGRETNEQMLVEAKILRLYGLYYLESWEGLVQESLSFEDQYGGYMTCDLLFLMAAGYARRGDELTSVRATDQYRNAISVLERFLGQCSAEHPNYQDAELLHAYCQGQLQ